MDGRNFNLRQEELFQQFLIGLSKMLNYYGFNSHNPDDRQEVLDVLEELHTKLYKGHIELMLGNDKSATDDKTL